MNANAPNTASCTTCCVCCKEIPFRCRLHPGRRGNTSNISAGWIAMNVSRHALRPRQNLTLRLSPAVRSRQIEAYLTWRQTIRR